MTDPKKHKIAIRYIATEYSNISSAHPPRKIAELFYDWWESRSGLELPIVDITVDGEVFTRIEETRE